MAFIRQWRQKLGGQWSSTSDIFRLKESLRLMREILYKFLFISHATRTSETEMFYCHWFSTSFQYMTSQRLKNWEELTPNGTHHSLAYIDENLVRENRSSTKKTPYSLRRLV
jgi:hypothetical protein